MFFRPCCMGTIELQFSLDAEDICDRGFTCVLDIDIAGVRSLHRYLQDKDLTFKKGAGFYGPEICGV